MFVFDGKASADVKLALEQRQNRREKVNDSIDTLTVELSETLESLGQNEAAAAASLIILEDHHATGNIFTPIQEDDVPQFIPDSDDEVEVVAQSQQRTEEELKQHALELQSRISTLQRQTRRPTREIIESCKELLTILGKNKRF